MTQHNQCNWSVYAKVIAKVLLLESLREYVAFKEITNWFNQNNLLDSEEYQQWQNKANQFGQAILIGTMGAFLCQKGIEYWTEATHKQSRNARRRPTNNMSSQSLERCPSNFSFFEYVWDQVTVGLGYESTYNRHVSTNANSFYSDNADQPSRGSKKKQRKQAQQAQQQIPDDDSQEYPNSSWCCRRSY